MAAIEGVAVTPGVTAGAGAVAGGTRKITAIRASNRAPAKSSPGSVIRRCGRVAGVGAGAAEAVARSGAVGSGSVAAADFS